MEESQTSHAEVGSSLTLVPGARIVMHSQEWLVRGLAPSADGGHLVARDGLSELVIAGDRVLAPSV